MPSSHSSMRHISHEGHGEDLEHQTSGAPLQLISIPLFSEENTSHSTLEVAHGHEAKISSDHHSHPPIYKRRTEANSTELFFDLFFVANLTVFTTDHEIDNGEALSSYVLFFSILWFTWLQVTLFDARFSADSMFERLFKALHFGVMIGFAVVGPTLGKVVDEVPVYQQLTMILLASRVLLIIQYSTVLIFTRKKTDALIPLVLQIVTLFTSAIIFIGIFFSFTDTNGIKGYIGWLVVSIVEALSLFAISSLWTNFSFRHSPLPNRVGLLTLIILGEGIIGFARTLSKIDGTVAPVSILAGVAISAVLITYFLFLLYFDQIDIDRFGTIRQHIWAFVHFPLHLAVLLTMEGVNQMALFSVAYQQVGAVVEPIDAAINNNADISNSTLATTINGTVALFAANSQAIIPETINSTLADLVDNNATDEQLGDLSSEITTYVFSTYGYEIESFDAEGAQKLFDLISTAYLYFFIAAGSALLVLAVLLWLGKRHKSAAEYSSIVVRVAVGSALCLITLMDLDSQADNFSNFVGSGWTVPMVMLSLGLVLVLDVLGAWVFRRREKKGTFRKA